MNAKKIEEELTNILVRLAHAYANGKPETFSVTDAEKEILTLLSGKYEHRVLLWINLCLNSPKACYVVEEHYEGWFLLGMATSNGQISYHCPNKYLNLVSTIKREHLEFDGHDSKIVIERLKAMAAQTGKKG
jgi:hypothetical protein